MIPRIFYNTIFFLLALSVSAQVKVGEWTDHLCYSYANSVARAGNYVYVSNGSGLARYNPGDNSIEKLTKINGLSDIGVKLLRYNEHNNTLVVVYDNANIDVIKNDVITNLSDIKRKVITGNKIINEVSFYNQYAYIACGFGIVVFDTDKLEIKDTYYIGAGGANVNIYQVCTSDTAVMAATESGIYYANKNTLLNNYQNWHQVSTLPGGPYNGIVRYDSKIIVNYSEKIKSNADGKDTLYQFDGTSWGMFTQKNAQSGGYTIKRLYDYNAHNKLMLIDQFGLLLMQPGQNNVRYITQYNDSLHPSQVNDGYYEDHGSSYYLFWIADNQLGLVRSLGGPPDPSVTIPVNGPASNYANDLAVQDGFLYAAPMYLHDDWSNSFISTPINAYQQQEWLSIGSSPVAKLDTIFDINCVAIDPNDKNHTVYGSWGNGLLEVRNNQITHVYNTANSPVQGAYGSNTVRIGGLCYDANSNLLVSASHNNKFLNILRSNGTWTILDFTNFISSNPTSGKPIIDKNNQVWLQIPRGGGMLVYKTNGSYPQPNSSNTRLVSVAKGSGGLPTNDIYSLVEDKDGHIWVGTGEGIAVFYNPGDVFTGNNWDCQQILIQQDGYTQILLQTEVINAIAVDGANRKWVGTESSGVYCFSSDGQEQIYHFAIDNSPIYSNTIRDIVTDETTGDVFIATDKGIQAYRTSIIKGFDQYTNVHAYPNPARPGYGGNVYITGLIDQSIVKITDISGSLVWEAQSTGGQIEWNLQTLGGMRVASGVYLIYCSSSDGTQSAVTKLLVVN